jgi:hypothetical protein
VAIALRAEVQNIICLMALARTAEIDGFAGLLYV